MRRLRRAGVHWLLVSLWAISLFTLAFPARAQAQAGGGSTHVVSAGETLSEIARQYGTDVATLLEMNGLSNANLVYVGQQLVVAAGENGSGAGNGGGSAARWQDDERSRSAPEQQRQGASWEPQASDAPYQRAGVGWEPQAAQRNPNRAPQESDSARWDETANEEPDEEETLQAGRSWEPQSSQRSPYNPEWESVHTGNGATSPGSSWEPQQDVKASREAELSGEKWIDIDIGDQVLTAYQGDTVVRTFTISSGSSRYPTVTGSFRTYSRTEMQDMSGGSHAAGDYYFQADVPWVQYFFEGYAIHGAYWHNQFGTPIGHGCINMRVEESRWLYEWAGELGIRVEVHQ